MGAAASSSRVHAYVLAEIEDQVAVATIPLQTATAASPDRRPTRNSPEKGGGGRPSVVKPEGASRASFSQSPQQAESTPSPSQKRSTKMQLVSSTKYPWLVKMARFTTSDASSLQPDRVIGRGAGGLVRLTKQKDHDKFFVLKTIRKDWIIQNNEEQHIRNEKSILTLISHPFCVKLLGTLSDRTTVSIAMEYCAGGSLRTRLQQLRRLPPQEAKFYMTELLSALNYLHSKCIVHRDLTPENICLDEEGHVKLVDFGSAIACKENRMVTICGTPAYRSPELLDSKMTKGYTSAVDCWAFGVVLYECLVGKTPFCNDPQESPYIIYMRILKNQLSLPGSRFDTDAKNLVFGLLNASYDNRLKETQEIMQSRYFVMPWPVVQAGRLKPPYIPNLAQVGDVSHFPHVKQDVRMLLAEPAMSVANLLFDF